MLITVPSGVFFFPYTPVLSVTVLLICVKVYLGGSALIDVGE